MPCIETNAVQAYLGGHAGASARATIDEHLDVCSDCRALVAAAAQVEGGLEQGERISRYLVGERIGGGAMGVVHAAEDPELRRKVAIKLLHAPGDGDADARLLREAQALARVSHPNVVSVFDAGTHDGRVFLAMELVEGQHLRAWLAERPHSVREILEVFLAAGRGLVAAHAAGLVHRDFKPDNVLVGADGRVRVTDFGLARGQLEAALSSPAIPEPSDFLASELTASRTLVGTPAYMAPEQLEGRPADTRSDQFSYCVALYEALYGRRPFRAASLPELELAIRSGRVEDEPRPLAPSLRRILLRGLARDPARRFPSMEALLVALARERVRRPRRLAAGALALLLLSAVALVADAVARAGARSDARAELAAAGEQLGHALAQRYQRFSELARVTSVLPLIREVAGNVDKAEFGLGDPAADAGRLELLHENLASADWSMWTQEDRRLIAVGDYKGRLIYSTGAPRAFGTDLRVLDAVARAYGGGATGVSAMVVGGRDRALRASRLIDAPGDVLVVLAGAPVPGATPRAVFVQAIDGRQLLDELGAGGGTELALVADSGASVGRVPPAEDDDMLVLRRPIGGPGDPTPIATVVLSRRIAVGVPHARPVLVSMIAIFLVIFLVAARGRRDPLVLAPKRGA